MKFYLFLALALISFSAGGSFACLTGTHTLKFRVPLSASADQCNAYCEASLSRRCSLEEGQTAIYENCNFYESTANNETKLGTCDAEVKAKD